MYGHQGGKVGNQVDWEIGIDMCVCVCVREREREKILASAEC